MLLRYLLQWQIEIRTVLHFVSQRLIGHLEKLLKMHVQFLSPKTVLFSLLNISHYTVLQRTRGRLLVRHRAVFTQRIYVLLICDSVQYLHVFISRKDFVNIRVFMYMYENCKVFLMKYNYNYTSVATQPCSRRITWSSLAEKLQSTL